MRIFKLIPAAAGIVFLALVSSCGKVSEFEDENLKLAIAQYRTKGFYPSHYSLYIYGLCSKCMGLKRKKHK